MRIARAPLRSVAVSVTVDCYTSLVESGFSFGVVVESGFSFSWFQYHVSSFWLGVLKKYMCTFCRGNLQSTCVLSTLPFADLLRYRSHTPTRSESGTRPLPNLASDDDRTSRNREKKFFGGPLARA